MCPSASQAEENILVRWLVAPPDWPFRTARLGCSGRAAQDAQGGRRWRRLSTAPCVPTAGGTGKVCWAARPARPCQHITSSGAEEAGQGTKASQGDELRPGYFHRCEEVTPMATSSIAVAHSVRRIVILGFACLASGSCTLRANAARALVMHTFYLAR